MKFGEVKSSKERIVIDVNNHCCSDIDGLFETLRKDDGKIVIMESGLKKIAYLQSIGREDGSGFSFIVTVITDGWNNTRSIWVCDFEGRRKAERREKERALYRM